MNTSSLTPSQLLKLKRDELIEMCAVLGIVKCKSKTKPILVSLIINKLQPPVINETHIKSETNIHQLNALDLFCGCGGMSQGLTQAGINVIAGIDVWERAIESYNSNHTGGRCADLTSFSPEEFAKSTILANSQHIDLICGGPPCQGFSIAGKRANNDPRNSLFVEFVKYIEYFKPKAFIMENVVGILSMKTPNNELVIDIIMQHFTNYNTCINKLYASDFEVPQNRRRIIIVGIRKDLNIQPSTITPYTQNRIPVKTVLQPREEIDSSYYLSDRALSGIANKKAKSKSRGAGFGAQYLDLEKPSYTIPARYWKDGYDALVRYTDTEVRRLTLLELKRIQSFPDDYVLCGTKKDMVIQIGNAVPCKLAYHLGKYIINTLHI